MKPSTINNLSHLNCAHAVLLVFEGRIYIEDIDTTCSEISEKDILKGLHYLGHWIDDQKQLNESQEYALNCLNDILPAVYTMISNINAECFAAYNIEYMSCEHRNALEVTPQAYEHDETMLKYSELVESILSEGILCKSPESVLSMNAVHIEARKRMLYQIITSYRPRRKDVSCYEKYTIIDYISVIVFSIAGIVAISIGAALGHVRNIIRTRKTLKEIAKYKYTNKNSKNPKPYRALFDEIIRCLESESFTDTFRDMNLPENDNDIFGLIALVRHWNEARLFRQRHPLYDNWLELSIRQTVDMLL